MSILRIEKLNDIKIKVWCEPDIALELNDYFTFTVPGAKFTPAYKNKFWDGKIRLFHTMSRTIYAGLRLYVEIFARERDYEIEYVNPDDFIDDEYSVVEAAEEAKGYLIDDYVPRDYQLEAVSHAIRTKRCLLLSPTASGKSLIIYLIARHFQGAKKTLIIVPTVSLVHQMASDFGEYSGLNSDQFCHKILAGAEKDTKKPFIISTWQSIYEQPKSWFDQFETVIGDEAHLFKSKSLVGIMEKMPICPYRFGFTGTLDGTQTHKLVLEGIFGPVKKVTTTAELIEQKHLSEFKIKAIVLTYDDEIKKLMCRANYPDEVDFISKNKARNNFITNLTQSIKGNTLILFKNIEHGKTLLEQIKPYKPNTYYVDGSIDGDLREDIRKNIEEQDDGVIIASYGTFSTGVNIRNLHNVVFASPSKSRIRNLQSIGRGLRKGNNKMSAVLYDIADDLSWKSKKNHTLLHLAERIRIYNDEKFDYKIYNVKLRSKD